jgi:hypothetical protein
MAEPGIRYGDAITTAIAEWARQNSDKVREAWSEKGGWECWAQVELARSLRASIPGGGHVTVLREERVYQTPRRRGTPTKERADLVLRSAATTLVIELKCESINNVDDFGDAVYRDYEKVRDKEIMAAYFPTAPTISAYCIGLAATTDGDNAIRDLNTPPRDCRFLRIEEPGCPVVIWWKKFSVQRPPR